MGRVNRWQYIIIHHSATPGGNAAQFDRIHRAKGWDGLGYHFVITNGNGGPDGHVEVGERWWVQKHGAHAGSVPAGTPPDEKNCFNEFGIGICLVGNFELRPPSPAQMKALALLVQRLREEFAISPENILGHQHVKSTACPGRLYPWTAFFAQLQLPPPVHLQPRALITTRERCPWCAPQAAWARPPAAAAPAAPKTPAAPKPAASAPAAVLLRRR